MLRQEREWKKPSVDMALAQMRLARTPTLLLAVQGGVFAEGVDYPGNMLIGAIIVGPPLPTFDLESEILREYYETNYGTGFHYAYIYPAMAKVVQAAGRVIRTETDKGLIVLMDKRFLAAEYADTLPSDWFDESINELVSKQISADIDEFWQNDRSDKSDISAQAKSKQLNFSKSENAGTAFFESKKPRIRIF